jgi:hypothetical protein
LANLSLQGLQVWFTDLVYRFGKWAPDVADPTSGSIQLSIGFLLVPSKQDPPEKILERIK